LILICLVVTVAVANGKRKRDIDPINGPPKIWELTDGEDKGIGGGFDIVDDLRTPPWVFDYTYDQGKTMSVGNNRFLIPDGMAGVSVHKFIGVNETRLSNTWDEFWKYQTKSTSITASVKFENVELGFAYTGTKGYINKLTNNGTKSFGWNGGMYLTFALQFRGLSRPPLDSDFVFDIKNLPSAYDASKYARFIRAWGTHYFTRALYGCEYNFTASLDNKFTEADKKKWSTSQIDLTLKVNQFEFGIKQNKEVNRSNIDGSIASAVQVTANAKGGDELKFTMERDFTAWLDSCHTMKVPIVQVSDLEPLTELIDDPVKKANIARAITAYGTTGKLQM